MRKFNFIKNFDKKHFYLFLLVLFGFITIFFSTSYGLFKKSDHLTDIDFVAGDLNYTITNSSLTDNSITVASGSERELTLMLTSLNTVSSKYELYYLIDGVKTANDSVIVGYTSGTANAVKGTISANASKKITVKIKNVSDKSVTITFGCEGGLTANTLTLSKGLSLDRLINDGDIEMYYTYVGNFTSPSKFPSRGEKYFVESVTCNGAEATWDNYLWSLTFSNVSGEKIICSFKINDVPATEYVMNLARDNSTDLRIETHNAVGNQNFEAVDYRYYGLTPNNYIKFNDETWRIVGVFDVDDGNGNVQKRMKIVRNSIIGQYSWDTSDTTVNEGNGVNEWSQSKLMTLLNSGPYYTRSSGTCYYGAGNSTVSCDFSTTGLTSIAKGLIGDAVWYLGAYTTNDVSYGNMYVYERGTRSGKGCSSSDSCNDTVTRTTTWKGKVGLIYPSDYGYSADKVSCPSYTSLKAFQDSCGTTSWLHPTFGFFTISPISKSSNNSSIYYIYSYGNNADTYSYLNSAYATGSIYTTYGVEPSVYLLPDVKIIDGTGSSTDMYVIGR